MMIATILAGALFASMPFMSDMEEVGGTVMPFGGSAFGGDADTSVVLCGNRIGLIFLIQ